MICPRQEETIEARFSLGFTESIIRMPHSFYVGDHAAVVEPPIRVNTIASTRVRSLFAGFLYLFFLCILLLVLSWCFFFGGGGGRFAASNLPVRNLGALPISSSVSLAVQTASQPPERIEVTRQAVGLPEDAFVFAATAAPQVLDPPTVDAWLRVLSACDTAVLWLGLGTSLVGSGGARGAGEQALEAVRANLTAKVTDAGLDPTTRLFFFPTALAGGGGGGGGPLNRGKALATLALADAFLDTTTVGDVEGMADALWAGVPVVTVRGRQMSTRLGASLVEAAGCGGAIVADLREYEATCGDWCSADGSGAHNELRTGLADRRETLPLFNLPDWVSSFETQVLGVVNEERRSSVIYTEG